MARKGHIARKHRLTQTFKEKIILLDFLKRCPDFPGGDVIASAMMTGLKKHKWPFTVETLVCQWRELKRQTRFRKVIESRHAREKRYERFVRRFVRMTIKQQEHFLRSKEYKNLLNEMR